MRGIKTISEKLGKVLRRVKPEPPVVVVGAMYQLREEDGNPFSQKSKAKVKDVRDGWVLYSVVPGPYFPNESMRIKTFLDIYKILPGEK